MPLTLPTHPVAVVPLKLWRPRWFDGVALVIGSVAPDVAYVEDGYGLTIHSHAWHAVLWWAVPVTMVLVPLVRWAAPVVATHLPGFADFGVLATARHRWWVTAGSAVIGATSHIVWDSFTHPWIDSGGNPFPALHRELVPGEPWWHVLSNLSNLVGFVAGAALLLHIGRSGVLRRWHGAPPVVRPRPVPFWTAVAVVLTAGVATLPLHPVRYFADQAIRVMLTVGLALLVGAAVVRVLNRGRTVTESVRFDTVTFDEATDHDRLVLDVLSGGGGVGSLRSDHFPVDWVFRAYTALQGTPHADRLSRAVAGCLVAADPEVRWQAASFFQVHPESAGAERVVDAVAASADPQLLKPLAARVGVGDGRALELAKAHALRPGGGGALVAELIDADLDWVLERLDDIVRESPSAGATALIHLQGRGLDLVAIARRIARWCRDDPRFELDVSRFVDDPAVRAEILVAFHS